MSRELTPFEVRALRRAWAELQQARAQWRFGMELLPGCVSSALPVSGVMVEMRSTLDRLAPLLEYTADASSAPLAERIVAEGSPSSTLADVQRRGMDAGEED